MPVFFYIDPEISLDYNLRHAKHLTLAYTFFKTKTIAEARERFLKKYGDKLTQKLKE
jgi:cytochrome c oxidase assembly protein Cox11